MCRQKLQDEELQLSDQSCSSSIELDNLDDDHDGGDHAQQKPSFEGGTTATSQPTTCSDSDEGEEEHSDGTDLEFVQRYLLR